MQLVDEKAYPEICKLVVNDVEKCLYVYLNMLNCKKEGSPINVYVNDMDDIRYVLVEYHNSFQVYKAKDISEEQTREVIGLFAEKKPKMISGTAELIESVHKGLKGSYSIEHGGIFIADRFRDVINDGLIARATEDNAKDIAELIAIDSGLGSHYDLSDLEEQFRSRIHAGTGRSYVIYENGKLAAHTATYAESEGIAVVSGSIIHPDYREKNYYLLLSNYMIKKLMSEKKTVYTFAVDGKMYKYHLKMHKLCGKYARIKLKGE